MNALKATPPEVVAWINDVFRRRLRDDPEVAEMAIAHLKVGSERGEQPTEIIRNVIAGAVLQIAGIDPTTEEPIGE